VNDFRVQSDARSRTTTKKLVRRLGIAGYGHWVFAQCEIRNQAPEGDTSHWSAEDWALAADWPGDPMIFIRALLEAGLVAPAESEEAAAVFPGINGPGWIPLDWRREQGYAIREPMRQEAASIAGKASGEARRRGRVSGQRTISFENHGDRTDRSLDPNAALPYPEPQPTNQPTVLPTNSVALPSPEIIVGLWNSIVAGKLPRVEQITPLRTTRLRTRSKPARDLAWWRAYFEKAVRTPFLLGDNGRKWRADFDFVIRSEEVVAKILEGSYDRAETQAGGFLSPEQIAARGQREGDGS
jgi:hypothetical protein